MFVNVSFIQVKNYNMAASWILHIAFLVVAIKLNCWMLYMNIRNMATAQQFDVISENRTQMDSVPMEIMLIKRSLIV